MTIVSFVTIHPNPGVEWDAVQNQIKKACDLARKHGAENVTVLATMIGGPATNTIGVLATAEDGARFGQIQQSFMSDSETQAACLKAARSPPGRRTSATHYVIDNRSGGVSVSTLGAPMGCPGSYSL